MKRKPPALPDSVISATTNSSKSSLKIEEEWLSTEQAAAYLKISVPTLLNMSSNGHVPYHKLGRRNRYSLAELRELLLSQKRGGFYGNKI